MVFGVKHNGMPYNRSLAQPQQKYEAVLVNCSFLPVPSVVGQRNPQAAAASANCGDESPKPRGNARITPSRSDMYS